jgi:hypothetical protein
MLSTDRKPDGYGPAKPWKLINEYVTVKCARGPKVAGCREIATVNCAKQADRPPGSAHEIIRHLSLAASGRRLIQEGLVEAKLDE